MDAEREQHTDDGTQRSLDSGVQAAGVETPKQRGGAQHHLKMPVKFTGSKVSGGARESHHHGTTDSWNGGGGGATHIFKAQVATKSFQLQKCVCAVD